MSISRMNPVADDKAGTVFTPGLNSAMVCKTEQTRLPEYCSIAVLACGVGF
jgi:hypothetical protein